MTTQNPTLSRRALIISAPLCLGTACATLPTYSPPQDAPPWPLNIPTALFTEAAPSLYIEGQAERPPLLITRHSADHYSAVTMICTHRQCALHLRRDQLICPCHGSRFTTAGALLQGPAQTPLPRHPTTLLTPTTLQITRH